MPIHEYECQICGRFEVIEKLNQSPTEICDTCGSPVTKLISAPGGLIFSGSGFYATDYKKKETKEVQKAEKNGGKNAAKNSSS